MQENLLLLWNKVQIHTTFAEILENIPNFIIDNSIFERENDVILTIMWC